MMLLFSDVLYMLMRYASPSGPMCLRCLMLTLSGPGVIVFLMFFYCRLDLCCGSFMLVVCSLSVFLSMCLFVLCVLCMTVFVNCVLNALAICVGEVNVFSLKVMVLFLGCVFLLASPCIVYQRVCVLCLRSQCVSKCSLHMSNLCVCMRDVISEFSSEIEGSHTYCALMLFLFFFLLFCLDLYDQRVLMTSDLQTVHSAIGSVLDFNFERLAV